MMDNISLRQKNNDIEAKDVTDEFNFDDELGDVDSLGDIEDILSSDDNNAEQFLENNEDTLSFEEKWENKTNLADDIFDNVNELETQDVADNNADNNYVQETVVEDYIQQENQESDLIAEQTDNLFQDVEQSDDNWNVDDVIKADDFSESYNSESISVVDQLAKSENLAYLQKYDGKIVDKTYSIDKNFVSGEFDATSEIDTIHVSVGYDTYGWNVEFANGVFMSLRDVKEYQLRQGSLPFAEGNIMYADKVLRFKNVKRIVVFEMLKYFSYGV